MCKHVAAALYGIGARLDHAPDKLFLLRGADPSEMVAAAMTLPTSAKKTGRSRRLETSELSSIFGIDLDVVE